MREGAILSIENMATGYRHPRRPDYTVSADISIDLNRGELVCLIGPNGSGKSTLLRTLAGMQPPLHGKTEISGKVVQEMHPVERARSISVVLTDRVDTGFLNAYTLVSLGRYPHTDWAGSLTARDEEVIEWALASIGAKDLSARIFAELSDGEKQKVMIARALAQESEIIILDEPTAFLDVPRRVEIMGLLKRLSSSQGKAVLLSTHDLDLALRSADRIWLLSRQGQLFTGAPEDLVLQGIFEKTFRDEEVHFDPHYGTFTITHPHREGVTLLGDGLSKMWTRRALEREGFFITDKEKTGIEVTVMPYTDKIEWIVNNNGIESTFQSIYQLMIHMRSTISPKTGGDDR
jgi:iron complex transport system ATP-binding protein